MTAATIALTIASLIEGLRGFAESHADLVVLVSWVIFISGLLQSGLYIAQLPAAWRELRDHSQAEDKESPWQLLISDVAMPISLVVPAHNEEAGIVQSIRSMLALEYPDFEIVVVNDGSKDATLERMIEAFQLKPVTRACEFSVPHAPIRQIYRSGFYPRLVVIDKDNGGGKADAANAGINFTRNPLFCVVDADSLLESEALLRAVRPFMEDPRRMMAVGGTIRVVNGSAVKAGRIHDMQLSNRFLPLVQTVEYIRAFLMARLALSRWGVLTVVSGAFSIFRRSIAVEVGGFSHGTVGEDMEIVIKIHRLMREQKRDYAMRYVPEPVCWTEAPESVDILGRQRTRWARGSLEVFFKHFDMFLNPAYGRIGMIGFPLIGLIDVVGPVLEVLGYVFIPLLYLAGMLSLPFLLAYMAVTVTFGIFISVSAMILEEMELCRVPRPSDLCILALMAVLENFGYRQLNNVWRLIGWWQFLRGKKAWGVMRRKGFSSASTLPP
ncbi:MAG: glycosyltransferase family 2 protein [Pseudomonadota bacterium]|nr:glycosyltransferase family 2 protein [Pseudomonadota bacterium]